MSSILLNLSTDVVRGLGEETVFLDTTLVVTFRGLFSKTGLGLREGEGTEERRWLQGGDDCSV